MGSSTIQYRTMTNADPAFYPLMGPYLSRREIVKELGFPVWDDDGKVWYVAVEGEAVLGFAAVTPRDGRAVLQSAYVRPEHRGQGVYRALLDARLADYGVGLLTTTASALARPALEARGFVAVRARGRYTEMRRV